ENILYNHASRGITVSTTTQLRMKALILVIGILCLQIKNGSGACDLGYAINSFATDLFKELLLNATDNNIFFSPFSISTALAMTQLGTDGRTSQQMKNTLKVDNCRNHHQLFKQLLNDINGRRTTYVLKSANNIFPNTIFNIDPTYLVDVMRYYQAQVRAYNYTTQARVAVKEINEWISNNTEGKLKDVLSSADVNAFTMLLLVNAIYFKGDWKYTFDTKNTKSATFYCPSRRITVDMMMQTLNESQTHVYIKDDDLEADILELPYKGDEVSMVIILPKLKSDRLKALEDLKAKLTATKLASIQEEIDKHDFTLENREVNLRFPKLLISWRSALEKHLKNLGMIDVFSSEPGVANFSRICHGNKPCDLYINKVIHQTFVEVNEEGTEAAGVTITGMPIIIGGGPVDFRVDRPFLFLIRHKKSKAILFMGCITKATAAKKVTSCMTNKPCMKMYDGSPAKHCCGCKFQFKDPTKKNGQPQDPKVVLRKLKKNCNGEDCRESCLTEKCLKKYKVKNTCKVKKRSKSRQP
ncbi:unnamed protein product, partial [Owenia fusiformis]